jgi:hypothetical protein
VGYSNQSALLAAIILPQLTRDDSLLGARHVCVGDRHDTIRKHNLQSCDLPLNIIPAVFDISDAGFRPMHATEIFAHAQHPLNTVVKCYVVMQVIASSIQRRVDLVLSLGQLDHEGVTWAKDSKILLED